MFVMLLQWNREGESREEKRSGASTRGGKREKEEVR